MVGETVALELSLTQQIVPHFDLTPEKVDAKRHECQEDIHDLNRKEGTAVPVEGQSANGGRGTLWYRRFFSRNVWLFLNGVRRDCSSAPDKRNSRDRTARHAPHCQSGKGKSHCVRTTPAFRKEERKIRDAENKDKQRQPVVPL